MRPKKSISQYGLTGYPLGHSFSAGYFKEKFEKEGISASYRNFPLSEVKDFPMLLDMEPGLLGLNVTVPHKQNIIPFLDELDPVAAAIGAVNTIAISKPEGSEEDADNRFVLKGYNTDVIGFRESLEPLLEAHSEGDLSGHPIAALVLGTGGSSLAVCHALEQMGIDYQRVSRSAGEQRITYTDVDVDCLVDHHLLINTTPLGMFPEVDACPPIDYEVLGSSHLLFDLVYNPALTLFLRKGKEQGARVSNGHNMLIRQAEASWAIWQSLRKGGVS